MTRLEHLVAFPDIVPPPEALSIFIVGQNSSAQLPKYKQKTQEEY